MTLRTSNSAALTVLPPLGDAANGWEVRFVSEADFVSVLGRSTRWAEASFSIEASDVGAFTLKMRADDPLWSAPLPAGETGSILDREVVVQFVENGVVRFEGLMEDVLPDEVADDGPMVTLAGRGLAAVLERAIVLPEGMPTPISFTRYFTGTSLSVWLTLFGEATARGVSSSVLVPTFTGSADSLAVAWPDAGSVGSRSVDAGTDLLTLLDSYCEALDLVWLVIPGTRRLVVAKTYGTRLADKIVFYPGRHVTAADKRVSRREITTHVYAVSGDLALATAADTAAATKWGRREKWLVAGGAGDVSIAQAVASAEIRLSADEKTSRTLSVLYDAPGRKIFDDYTLGDYIGIEVPSGSVAEARIVTVAVRLDADGNPESEITLTSRFEEEEIRTRKRLALLGADSTSSAGGTPITVTSVSAKLDSLRLQDLSNVSTVTPTDGKALIYDAGSGLWKPTTIPAPTPDAIATLTDVTIGTPTDGQVLTYDSATSKWKPATSSGGGGGWTKTLDNPLSALTNMTAINGTWIVGTSCIQQTDASANVRGLRTNAKVNRPTMIAEVEGRWDSGSGLNRFGIAAGSSNVNDGAALAYLTGNGTTSWTVSTERAGATALTSGDVVTYTGGTWVKIRIVVSGSAMTVYVNGTYVATVTAAAGWSTRWDYVYLYTYQAAASFRNLKVWNPTEPV